MRCHRRLGQVGHLPPVLRAYDDRLRDQAARLEQYERDLTHLQARTAAVIAENEELQEANGNLLAAEVSQEVSAQRSIPRWRPSLPLNRYPPRG